MCGSSVSRNLPANQMAKRPRDKSCEMTVLPSGPQVFGMTRELDNAKKPKLTFGGKFWTLVTSGFSDDEDSKANRHKFQYSQPRILITITRGKAFLHGL